MALRKNIDKITCSLCNKNLGKDNYFSVHYPNEPVLKNGIPVCKGCIQELVNDELNGYSHFIRFLQYMDKPFNAEIFKEVGFDYYKYLVKASSKKFKGTFLESEEFFSRGQGQLQNADLSFTKLTPEELQDCRIYWGGDYTEEEYYYLITRYEKYCNTYDVDTPTFEGIVAQLCQLELDIKKKRTKGLDTSKDVKLQIDLMRSAGISPSQEKESKNNEKNTFGTMIKKWENERPIPEPLPEFKDVDGIAKYVRNNFLSPMLKSLEKDNPHEEEYQEHVDTYGISKEALLGIEGEE